MNQKLLYCAVIAGLAVLAAAVSRADDERALIAVLQSTQGAAAKCQACRQLRIVATAQAVPALSALLLKRETSHAARYALEAIPGPAATAALRSAVGQTAGSLKAGLLDSLGRRHDAGAIALLAAQLADADATIASAAAASLGTIGGKEAASALTAVRDAASPAVQPAVLEGLLKCAEGFAAGGDKTAAAEIYRALSAAKYPFYVQTAAWRGLNRCCGAPTGREILRLLAGNDRPLRDAAAGSLRDLSPQDLHAVADGMAALPAASQEAVLAAIRIRGDKSLARVVRAAAESKEEPVRFAAVRALGIVGDGEALPLLLRLTGAEGRIMEAAWQSLETLGDSGSDARIIAALQSESDASRRARLVDLIEARRSPQAVPVLLREATHPAAEVRGRAFAALARLAEPKDVPQIVALFLQAKAGSDREAAEKAIVLICQQAPNAQERAEPCLVVFRAAAPGTRIDLLPLLGRLGGAESKRAIVAALQSEDPGLYDAAVRALSNWPDASIAEDLLKIAQSDSQEPHRLLAFRAFIRVVSTPGTPDAQRLAQLRRAMRLASRDEERNLILSRAAAVRTIDTLRFLVPYLDDPALAGQACRSVAELGRHKELREPNRGEFMPALKKVLATSHDAATLELVRRNLAQ